MIAPMPMAAAGATFFFHVGDFAARGDFTIAADDASAPEGRETEKPNETHRVLPFESPAIHVPT